MTTALALTVPAQRAFERMAADLRRVLGDRLVALVAYTAHSSTAFATHITTGDLEAFGALVEQWHRDGLATPLLMTPDEFRRSLDAFPLEYQAILDRHVVIAGQSPFEGVRVGPEDLRRACEAGAKGHLIHLRQGWMESAGHRDDLAELIEGSAAPLRALLTNVARLHGADAGTTAALAGFAGATIGMPRDLIEAILTLEANPDGSRALVSRLGEYLAAAERLWTFVDGWRSA